MKSFLFQVFERHLKLPVEEIRVPKYVCSRVQYQCSVFLCGILDRSFSLHVFERSYILVFLELISNIQELLKEYNVLRQFCRPTLDRDKIIRSSAYKREFNLVPFGTI